MTSSSSAPAFSDSTLAWIGVAWAGVSNTIIGWRLVDGAVRYFNGDPIPSPVAFTPDDTSPAAWPVPRIYTAESAPDTSDFVEPADYTAIFSELWQS